MADTADHLSPEPVLTDTIATPLEGDDLQAVQATMSMVTGEVSDGSTDTESSLQASAPATCTKDSDEWRALNPSAPASSAKCFQHASEACAFKIAMDTKLDKQPGVTSLMHAAQIIRKLHYKDLDSNSFGKGSKYNRPWDGKRDKDIHKELRDKQKALGLFPKPDA